MGALHQGHLSLLQASKKECATSVAGIFVNPTQFAPHEDFATYPRPLEKDIELLRNTGADYLFIPPKEMIFPPNYSTWVHEDIFSQGLCGKFRPGHFQGVTTVVLKFLNIVEADIAYFGQKDLQQCKVIEKMVDDLNYRTKISICPTIRETSPDLNGLAMSSRNQYLSPSERQQAPTLYATLSRMEKTYRQGETEVSKLLKLGQQLLAENGAFRVQYLEIRDLKTMQPLERITSQAFIAVAAFLGKTRLIDNIILT
jgi:pantoate--beta-alanine ligase